MKEMCIRDSGDVGKEPIFRKVYPVFFQQVVKKGTDELWDQDHKGHRTDVDRYRAADAAQQKGDRHHDAYSSQVHEHLHEKQGQHIREIRCAKTPEDLSLIHI